jgi:hypothetical protein
LFAGHKLSHRQPETDADNSKLYSDVVSEASEFSEATKCEQNNKYMPKEAESANSKNGFSKTGLFASRVPKQDSYSNAGNQEESVSLPQSVIKPQGIHVPIPLVPKQENLETAVVTVKDIRPTGVQMKRKQTVCIRVKKNDMFWVHLFYHIQKLW